MKWWIIVFLVIVLLGIVLYYTRNSLEGFDTPSVLPDLKNTSGDVPSTPGSTTLFKKYTIFDPTGAYVQAQIATIEYPIFANFLILIESGNKAQALGVAWSSPANPTPAITYLNAKIGIIPDAVNSGTPSSSIPGNTRISQAFNYFKTISQASLNASIAAKEIWTTGVQNPVPAATTMFGLYSLDVFGQTCIQNIDTYYKNLLVTFQNHPIRFIVSGYSNGPSNLNTFPTKFGTDVIMKTLQQQASIESTFKVETTLLTAPAWTPKAFLETNATSSALVAQFTATRKTGVPTMYTTLDVSGTITAANINEIRQSIQYSIYFNFADTSSIETQLRVNPTAGAHTLQFCPTFNGIVEWEQYPIVTPGVNGGAATQVFGLRTNAVNVAVNNSLFTVNLTPAIFALLPYHCKQFIIQWAIARKTVIMEFLKETIADSDIQFDTQPPTFNLLNTIPALNPGESHPANRTYLDQDDIHILLDKIAQCYYNNCDVNGKHKMNKIYEVYQIGNTIIDVRYSEIVSVSDDSYAQEVSALKDQYATYIKQPLTDAELNNLDTTYTTQMANILGKTSNKYLGNASGCGYSGQYVRITASATQIQLSQIIVIDVGGNNVALNRSVITNSVLLPEQYDVTNHIYNVQSTINAEIVVNTTTNARQSLTTLLVDGTYTSRVSPNVYMSATTGAQEYVEVNLGNMREITSVQLVLPYTTSTTPATSYTISLLDSTRNTVKTGTTVPITTTDPRASMVQATFLTSQVAGAVPCPTSILNQYKVARFYATIDPSYNTAITAAKQLDKITITGFTEGIGAAHSFNPMYNGGFPQSIDNPTGNLIYVPKTMTTVGANRNLAKPLDLSANTLIEIMNDYRRDVNTATFRNRADVKAAVPAYTSANDYFPTQILAAGQISPQIVGIQWTETPVDKMTRINGSAITRVGRFVYRLTSQNFSFTERVYDVSNSVIYADMNAYTNTPGSVALTPRNPVISLQIPYPTSYTLDNASGFCPTTDCSDPNVIHQLVKWYNGLYLPSLKTASVNKQILVVNKAITPNANECQLGVIRGLAGGPYEEASIDFKLTVQYDVNSQPSCKYVVNPDATAVGNGTLVQSNTPLLSNPYSYVVEIAKPYTTAITSNVSTLLSYVAPVQTELSGVLQNYRADTYGAFGQIQGLKGCDLSENILNKCSNPAIMDQFLSYFNTNYWNQYIATSVTRAGTYSATQCDFTLDQTDTTGANGQTSGYRCVMQPSSQGSCFFTVSTCVSINPKPPTSSLYDMSYNLTTANMYTSSTVTYPTGPTTSATAQMIPGSYPNTSRSSPLNYINCASLYALKQMNSRSPLPASITAITQKGVDTCVINGTKQYVFQKTSNSVFQALTQPTTLPTVATGTTTTVSVTAAAVAAAPLNRGTCSMPAPVIPVPATATGANLEIVSGLKTITQAIDISGGGMREYRVAASDFLPFAATYKRVSFYNGSLSDLAAPSCTNIQIANLQDGYEGTSPYTYFDNTATGKASGTVVYTSAATPTPIVSRLFRNIVMSGYITAFRKAWKAKNCVASAIPQKWLGPITGFTYDPATDGVIFQVKIVYFGQYGNTDVSTVYNPGYIRVVYRVLSTPSTPPKPTDPDTFTGTFNTGNGLNVPNTFVYSMTEIGSPPSATTAYPTDTTFTDDTTYSVTSINTPLDSLANNYFRMFRVISQTTPSGRAEFTRLLFYSMFNTVGVPLVTPALISFVNPTITVADISANYIKSSDPTVQCQGGFTTAFNAANNYTVCTVDQTSFSPTKKALYNYTKGSGACGIGYIDAGNTCTTTAIFNKVLEDPAFIGNVSNGTPRLRLNLGQSVVISYDSPIQVDGFSFITGSAGTIPTGLTVEGSVNGTIWKTLVSASALNYASMNPANVGGTQVLSFFYPGIFQFPTTGNPVTTPSRPPTTPYKYPFYAAQVANITEGFVSPSLTVPIVSKPTPVHTVAEQVRVNDSYILPLKGVGPQHLYTKPAVSAPHPIQYRARIRFLRFRTLSTVDPGSKFVAMSYLTLHTRNGIVPSEALHATNLEGSRRVAKEGPEAIFAPWSEGRRWTDYNKSPLLISINVDILPADPITGYQFYIPVLAAAPSQWVIEGSMDGRSWQPVHEMKTVSANYLREYSPVYKFSQEI